VELAESSTVLRLVPMGICSTLVAVASSYSTMKKNLEQTVMKRTEQAPREYRVVLRRDYDTEAENPFGDVAEEPETGDILWEGVIGPDSADLWEEAGLIEPLDSDRFELQERDSEDTWQFSGVFSTSEDLQWVLDHSSNSPET